MTWDQAATALNASTLAHFGENVTVRTDAGDTPLQAVVVRPVKKSDMGGYPTRNTTPTAEFDTTQFAATGAGSNDIIIDAHGIKYTIIDQPIPDAGGMTKVYLQAFKQS